MISLINEISEKWFSYLADSSLQLIFFFVIVFLLSSLFRNRSAKFLYGLWFLLLIKAIIPPSIPLPFEKQIDFIPQISFPIYPIMESTSEATISIPQLEMTSYFFLGWFSVVVLLIGFVAWKNLSFRLKLKKAVPIHHGFIPDSIAESIGNNKISIFLLDNICAPFTINLFRSKIYLPLEAQKWDKKRLEAILMHELAHIKRKDLWVNLLQNVVQVFYFYHPFVWIANWQLNNLRERVCDDLVIVKSNGYSLEYTKYLLAHVDQAIRMRECPALVNYFHQNKRVLMKRFEYLIKKKEGTMLKFKAFEKTLLALLCFAAFGFTLANSGITEAIPQDFLEQSEPIQKITDQVPDNKSADPIVSENPVRIGVPQEKAQIKKGHAKIFGKITDSNTGDPISGAYVELFSNTGGRPIPETLYLLEGIRIGGASDPTGNYEINNVPPGKYQISVLMMGYEKTTAHLKVEVSNSEVTKYNVDFLLEVTTVDLRQYVPSSKKMQRDDDIIKPDPGYGQILGEVYSAKTEEPLPGANVTIIGTKLGSATDRNGKFIINNVPPGLYSLQANMIGFSSVIHRDLKVKSDLFTRTGFNLDVTEVRFENEQDIKNAKLDDVPAFVPYDTPPEPIGGFKALQRNVAYPEIAWRAGVEGMVVVQVLVDTGGAVANTKIVKSLGNNGCDEAAIAAIKKTKWKPAYQGENPVKVWVSLPVTFRLSEASQAEKYKLSLIPKPPVQDDKPMFVPYDKAPQPIGGFAAVQKNLNYPEISRRAGIQGMVIVQVLVDSTGEVTDTKIAKSLGTDNGCDEAAVEAIKKTKWEPAYRRDKAVKVWVSIPVQFKLKEQMSDLSMIVGIVLDEDGNPVKDAMIFIEGSDITKAQSNENGEYKILNVQPGDLTLFCGIPKKKIDRSKIMEELESLREEMKDPKRADEARNKIDKLMAKMKNNIYDKKVTKKISVEKDKETKVNFVIK